MSGPYLPPKSNAPYPPPSSHPDHPNPAYRHAHTSSHHSSSATDRYGFPTQSHPGPSASTSGYNHPSSTRPNVSGRIDGLMDELAYTLDSMTTPGAEMQSQTAPHLRNPSAPIYPSHQPSNNPGSSFSSPYATEYSTQSSLPPATQHHYYDRPPLPRPVSSSASGIISLYAEDTGLPDNGVIPSPATGLEPSAYHNYQEGSAPVSPLASPAEPNLRRHLSRPLPATPQRKAHSPSVTPLESHTESGPRSPREHLSERSTSGSYFNMPVAQPYDPTSTSTALYHSTSSSVSSRATYSQGHDSSSTYAQSTPNGSHRHRPLPSTSSFASDAPLSPMSEKGGLRREPSHRYGMASPPGNHTSLEHHSQIGRHTQAENLLASPPLQTQRPQISLSPDRGHSPASSHDYSSPEQQLAKSRRHPLPPLPSQSPQAHAQGGLNSSPAPRTEQYNPATLADPARGFESPRGTTLAVSSVPGAGELLRRSSIEKPPVANARRELDSLGGINLRSGNGVDWPDEPDAFDFSLLSSLAILLRQTVPRGTQIKGSIDYPQSFTGKDVVSTLQAIVPAELAAAAAGNPGINDPAQHRKIALTLAKSLKSQLFFHEVDWGENELRDGVEEVYTFLEDSLAGPSSSADPAIADWASGLALNKGLDLSLQLSFGGADESRERRNKPMTSNPNDIDELPTGVFTPLTRCYSPLCNRPGVPPGSGCYSPSCPVSRNSSLNRNMSSGSSGFDGDSRGVNNSQFGVDQTQKKAWAELVPAELLKSIPSSEVSRQNAILETIQKEEEFLSDLELLDSLFVKGLQTPSAEGDPPPLPIGPERDHFIAEVFANHRELAAHIRILVEKLHVRQREENPIVQTIGDIFLSAALEWGEAYNTYLVNYPLAISRVKREILVNPRFKTFVEACRRHPAAHKHPLENFLFRPPARLQRYHLHLESILKKTEEGNSDRDSLMHAIEIINEQCKTAQAGVEEAELKVKIREYAYNLATKRNKVSVDMDLLNPARQLIHQGRVLRKPDAFDFDWTELLAILFDNYFIVVKQKRREETDEANASAPKFVLAKRPIPVEMLELSGFSESSISRSIGLSNFHISRERESRDFWPFTVSHVGGKVEPLTLFVPSKDARNEWKTKLEEAIGLRTAVQDANKVFEPHTLSDDVFALPNIMSLEPERPVAGVDPGAFHGKVTCAVPFATSDGRRLVAIGCADGVWIGLRSDPRSLRKVLHLKLVTQCAVLESFGIFVVLADKVLISYSLEALVPSAHSNTSALRPPQKLSGNRDVLFFHVGVLKDRTLLIYMKKKANESVFRALEPILNAPRANEGKSGSGFFGKFGKDSKNTDWFRIYKTFFIPSEAYSMQFLKSKLCIVCARGFEIMNLDSLLPGTIPDFAHAPRDDPRVLYLQKRVETARPLGMFKTSESEFLLCYDAFACYVDRLGEPIKLESIIEWEGYPKDVAISGRFILAFDSRFVEVRDSQSGQLVQVIRGSDMRYISGSGTLSSASSDVASSIALGADPDANPVILVKRTRAPGRIPFDFQSVLELVPTLAAVPLSNYPAPFMRSNTMLSNSSRGSFSQSGGWI